VTFFLLPTAYAVLERRTTRSTVSAPAGALEPHGSALP